MPISNAVFLKFLGKELINPITYPVAFSIGAAINVLQGNSIFFQQFPMLYPYLCRALRKHR